MDVEIMKKNGDSFRLSDFDVQARDFVVSSIEVVTRYGAIEGRNGKIDYGAVYGDRTITVPFFARAKDAMDYPLLRDELFAMITSKESFYIRELRRDSDVNSCENEGRDDFVGSKRYLVRLADGLRLEQQFLYGFGELVFETTALPFSESIATTQELHDQLLYSDEKWSYGMGLLYDEESHVYTHKTREFSVYNAGNVPIHPFEQDLLITIANAAKNYELKNLTTGDTFKYTGNTQGALKLDGPNITLNSLQVFRDTNKRYITLAPGWNHFEQNQSREVSFDFRYYYL